MQTRSHHFNFRKRNCCYNATYLKSYQMLALAVSLWLFLRNWNLNLERYRVDQGHGGEKWYLHLLIATVWRCIGEFFSSYYLPPTNEFHIFLTFEIENISQGHRREKWNLCVRSQTFECVLMIFFIILAFSNIRKQPNFAYIVHLSSKMYVKVKD